MRHVQSLTALAGAEAREAGALYLRLAVMLVAALVLLMFGYILTVFFVAFLLASVFHVAWIWILMGLTILHLALAFLCALHVKRHWQTSVFESTRSEIAKGVASLQGKSV